VPTDPKERRRKPRINLEQVVRVRPFDPEFPPEYCTTFNISKDGLYLSTSAAHYTPGMRVYVTADFQPGSPLNHDVSGAVVRIDKLQNGQFGVAIHLFSED
jgi:PilZ domain